MNKYQEFFDYVEEAVPSWPDNISKMLVEIKACFEGEDKPALTEAGAELLSYLQNNFVGIKFKSKDVADGMGSNSRKVSGSLRKLVTDGFVDKIGQNPCQYMITEKGINFNIQEDKEKNNAKGN